MANAIQRIRLSRNMTVRQLGARLGVWSSTVTRMEHKDIRLISTLQLRAVARALRTTTRELLK